MTRRFPPPRRSIDLGFAWAYVKLLDNIGVAGMEV